ncbi:PQQ-dependent sugar dehydrogenase [Nocardioides sp. J54]|uniref:PQQ-dependent sugar dehydrogenase n=1 Tax=Nocardioides sp. J54 TaxID=935866 RepID=UPI00048F447C|nr:PQQ-dependent sugar dehydrogenase [Nocardioides sp. J54]
MRRPLAASLAALALVATACGQGGNEVDIDVSGTATAAPTGTVRDGKIVVAVDGVPDVVATVASGLAVPWGIDFLPDGRAVVTERDSARVLVVTAPEVEGGKPTQQEGEVVEAGQLPAAPRGEAGLLGVAVSPTFASDNLVYFYVTTAEDNRVVRAQLRDDRLGEPEPVLTGIPAGTNHDGGRLAFGPDGYLYVSTGEVGDRDLAQDRRSLAGKILRITADGRPAPDNPFGTEVWSWGHRNVEGLAFDPDGSLWASEFGDSKADELNRILPGENYGWPRVEGTGGPRRFAQPQLTWGTDEASPSGLAYAAGYLWMAGLRGERLWRVKVAAGQASDPTAYFEGDDGGEYGRLRTVARDADGRLWLATSNKDGRGTPAAEDDRILLIEP